MDSSVNVRTFRKDADGMDHCHGQTFIYPHVVVREEREAVVYFYEKNESRYLFILNFRA